MPSKNQPDGASQVVIKKYANRRLYNTATSSYITLDDLSRMVRDDVDFAVFDAKTGEDITRSVLTQIIVEEEAKGQNLLPIGFLRQLIGMYGDSLQELVPRYLEHSMESFIENQEQMREYLSDAFDDMFPFGSLEDISQQNMTIMQQALAMFNPTQKVRDGANEDAKTGTPSAADPFAIMQAQINALQQQMHVLVGLNKKK
ncbi:MAG: polyhydroxyalkanoate synthesis repressor PhaR [Rhodospirillaceae bacterium]|nr:polyhydroxyalkanoate synthesis repressor PhaR [Rhodospirillaceae bacterium]